jgi:RimJ/RimL family protein N-acetyltransferase
MTIFETSRLVLRHFTLKDTDFLIALVNTPSWLNFIGNRHVYTQEDASNYLQNRLIKGYESGFGFYLVALKDTQEPIGVCGFVKRAELENVDIGFAFLPEYEGKGYAFEAASETLLYGKNTLGLEKIVAIISKDNQRSIKLTEKLGFRFEKMVLMSGEKEEIMMFSN